MDMDRINSTFNQLNNLINRSDTYLYSINPDIAAKIKDSLLLIAEDIKNEYPGISNRLRKNREFLFMNKNNYNRSFCLLFNPFRAGGILEALSFLLEAKTENQECLWNYVHQSIITSSKKLYLDGHHTNAALVAFIEVNSRLKKIYKILKPEEDKIPDGVDLMNKIFSEKSPLLPFRTENTETDKNIQRGFHFMFTGAILALRNPKAHSNDEIISAEEALRRLMFASTLMYAIDEAISNNGINEISTKEI